MPTVVELKEQARKLGLTGYSTLKKPALETVIAREIKRREDAQLEAIRQAPAPEAEKIKVDTLIPTLPLEIDSTEVDDSLIQAVKGKGLTNLDRVRRYLARTPGRKKLTVAEARRIRKNFRKGDLTVPVACNYAGLFNAKAFIDTLFRIG